MEQPNVQPMRPAALTPGQHTTARDYLGEMLSRFLKKQERILLCCPADGPDSLCSLMQESVRDAGAVPIPCGKDLRWKTLLWLAFSQKTTAIAGPPAVILGLAKLSRLAGTPLFIRNAVLIGDPCPDWMHESIQQGLDCRVWDCYAPDGGPMVIGFSCGRCRGIHLREPDFSAQILSPIGTILPYGTQGQILLTGDALSEPRISGYRGRLECASCFCTIRSPRLLSIQPDPAAVDPELVALQDRLLSWGSVLDCRLARGEYGLEMELVTFPGEKLPKLPTAARQIVRPWESAGDVPFCFQVSAKKPGDSHRMD